MNPERPSAYEQLSPEAAARVDAVCDGFERAWKAVRSGAAAPCLTSFLEGCEEPERTVLARELVALERACQERYAVAPGAEGSRGPVSAAEVSTDADAHTGRGGLRPHHQTANWPRLPGLELVGVLGYGGAGVVFKARQPTLGREVAVKVLRDIHVGDAGQRERFLQEARAVARLQHPHLVQLHEFGEVPGPDGATSQPYLVLEYVSGGSLADLLRGSRLTPEEAARLVETLAEAIHYAHQQGVIHRDLKPANILLQAHGLQPVGLDTPKITDFGLAKFLTGSHLTQTGDVLGTPSYMAPEQASGKAGAITAAVDVYGLGAILYEALAGRPPFVAATVQATVHQVREDNPLPPRHISQVVPRDLQTICLKCLRKEPRRRYATAQELADDLRRFRTGEPIRARPVGPGERLVGWCRRKPLVAGLLAALTLVFVVGLAGVLWQGQLARQKAAEAEASAARLKREQDTANQEKERADRNLRRLREKVDRLTRLGRELSGQPEQHKTALALLGEALAFYQEILAEEGKDPRLRHQAARMYGEVAYIYHSVGQWGRAAEAFRLQAELLSGLRAEEPADPEHGRLLAVSHRSLGNVLRDLGEVRQARAAYDRAAELHEQFLLQSPNDPGSQVALANTLLNKATLISPAEEAAELEGLYRRVVKLDRDAVKADGNNANYQAELALGLEDQGLFFLATGRAQQARDAVSEALALRQKVLAGGRMKGYIEQYVARSYANHGRVLAAVGLPEEAEQSYKEALKLLERLVKVSPMSPHNRMDLAGALIGLANLLKEPSRQSEVVDLRRQMIGHYEILKARFPEDRPRRRLLALSYLELVRLLWRLERQSEADEPYRKAFAVDPEDPEINNELAWFLATSPETRLRDAARAVRLAQKAIGTNANTAKYWNTLGVAHYRNGEDRAATAALEKAMSLREEGNSYDWFFLAMAHWRLGDHDKARTCFGRAVKWMDQHMPQHGQLRRFRAEAEALLGQAGKP
jgi:tetratricopeptide (TPR) repeat protein/tRNA A-37 threonylcarbamoyl transferase component Bud32